MEKVINNENDEILTYNEARQVLGVLELRLNKDVEKWREWSKEYIEVPAGRVVITKGANSIIKDQEGLNFIRKCLARHLYGDFGDLKYFEDWQENILAIWTRDGRILSRYIGQNGTNDIYIITEGIGLADYHYTTIMLVDEY